jgi:hypothetical protein
MNPVAPSPYGPQRDRLIEDIVQRAERARMEGYAVLHAVAIRGAFDALAQDGAR